MAIKKVKSVYNVNPLISEKTHFAVTEAYKAIRTNLIFTLQNPATKRIIITSTSPYEGKSTNCCNLGITLAQTGTRVLILDCDLRKPVVHKCFGRDCIPGLSDLLAGMKDSCSEIVHDTDYPNLSVICSGTIPPNPIELLSSAKMEKLLDDLSQAYDYILLDTPPISMVADALALSSTVEGVVIVVKQGQTTHPELAHALASLRFAKAKVLGIILNGAKPSRRHGYKKYRHRYGTYYE